MKTRTLVTGAILGALLLCGSCAEFEQYVVQSQKERNWLTADSSAITSAETVEEPRILPQTHFAAARLHEQNGQIDKAIIQYRKAIAVNHDYTEAYNRLGILLGRLGRHADAEKALRRCVELEPRRAALRNNLGYEYALQGRWSDAEAELSNAIRLDAQFARAYVNLGMVLCKTQRFEEALETFNAVLPEPDAFYNLGLMLRGQHRYQDAASAFRHVLTLDANFAAAQQQLETLAPQLALASELEPSAELDQWAAVTNPRPSDEVVEPTRLAGADAATEPSAPAATEAVDDTDTVAILTSAETAAWADQEAVNTNGDPCPRNETDWTRFTEADEGLITEDLEAESEPVEQSLDRYQVRAPTEQTTSQDIGKTTDSATWAVPPPQPEPDEEPITEAATNDSTDEGLDTADSGPVDIDMRLVGTEAVLLSPTPELAVNESIAGFDPCYDWGLVAVRWR